jgi:hypothetical protein
MTPRGASWAIRAKLVQNPITRINPRKIRATGKLGMSPIFQTAEPAVPGQLFKKILQLINEFLPRPASTRKWGYCKHQDGEGMNMSASQEYRAKSIVWTQSVLSPDAGGLLGFSGPQK